MDIRKYFGVNPIGKQNRQGQQPSRVAEKLAPCMRSDKNKKNNNTSQSKLNKVKKKSLIFDSDSDTEDPLPSKPKKRLMEQGRDDMEIVSQSENKKLPTVQDKKVGESIVKQVSINSSEYFSKRSAERNEKIKNNVTSKPSEQDDWLEDFHDDSDFEKVLRQLDEMENKAMQQMKESKTLICTSIDATTNLSGNNNVSKNTINHGKEKSRTSSVGSSRLKTPEKVATDSIDSAKSSEKKRIQFLEYKNRAGPRALGSKEIPEGEDGCLVGFNFVITGVLESLEREEIADLIKKYGGKVSQSLSKNTSFMVVGIDAGPSKLEKAAKLGTKQISEDHVLEMIRTRKGKKDSLKHVGKSLRTSESAVGKKLTYSEAIPGTSRAKDEKLTVLLPKTKAVEKRNDSLLWVDKYKPTNLKQIVGQQGEKSNAKKLLKWLLDWHKINERSKTKKASQEIAKSRWKLDDGNGCGFKAVLLSGPPGVGKTTTACLVCKEAGFQCVELNASDTRSKRSLQEEVSNLLNNHSLTNNLSSTSRHCLVMDEVDGMAGNEDRGGVQELIALIKSTKVPIICLCNDRYHRKIQSLCNYCFDLRFQKPRVEQIKGAMMSICFKENFTVSPITLQELIVASQQDVRQVIHHLSLMSAKSKFLPDAKNGLKEGANVKKDTKLSAFDACRKVFDAEAHKTMNIHEKNELFFYDYSIAPLFVQENYIHMKPLSARKSQLKELHLLSRAADSLCDGDLSDKLIRSQNNWSLLPVQALFSSIVPGELLECRVPHRVTFPSWLGKNSRRGKLDRISRELATHMRLRISGNKTDVNTSYSYLLRESIVRPLRRSEVDCSVAVMEAYDLMREDLDNLLELCCWPGREDPMNGVAPKVKAAFTRTYNNCHHRIPYAVTTIAKKNKKIENYEIDEVDVDEEGGEEEDDEEETAADDAMVKVKNATTKRKSSSTKGKAERISKRSRKN